MKITGARAVLLSHKYPSEPRLEWVGGHIESWDAALVQIGTDEGLTGLGEVAQGIMGAVAVPGVLDGLLPMLIGQDVADPTGVADDLRDRNVFWARGALCSGVIAAVEAACWDVLGKARDKPVYELLGGAQHDEIELYASGGLGTSFEEVASWCAGMHDRGFRTVKFRAQGSPDRTIELLHAVAPSLPDDTQFVLDAVQGCARRPWSTNEAVRVGEVVGALDGRWYEEPARAEDLDGYAAVRRAVEAPISGVESYTSSHEFARLIERDGVDIVQPDAAMVGGPGELRRVAAMAEARGLGCVPHVWGTAGTIMANLHTAFATPNMPLFEMCTIPNPLREALFVQPLDITNGRVHPPTAPGLGIALTDEIEAHFPFIPGGGHVIA